MLFGKPNTLVDIPTEWACIRENTYVPNVMLTMTMGLMQFDAGRLRVPIFATLDTTVEIYRWRVVVTVLNDGHTLNTYIGDGDRDDLTSKNVSID